MENYLDSAEVQAALERCTTDVARRVLRGEFERYMDGKRKAAKMLHNRAKYQNKKYKNEGNALWRLLK